MTKHIYHFLGLAITVLAAVRCSKNGTDNSISLSCEQPPFLSPGDKVALISPSYYTPMENVYGAADVIREWGFEPIIGPNVGKTYHGKYAGTPKERVEDIRWALRDTSIKAILCNRGGYGTISLVDLLPLEELKANPKWLIGFSDITTLHGMETRAGVMSIHGTMSSLINKSEGLDVSTSLVYDILTGTHPNYIVPSHPQNIAGKATGTLVGGNICTFVPVLGTDADATNGEDIILFIEEVEESMHNIDRLFNMLILNGVIDRCKGVILGEFTDCSSDLEFGSVEEMLFSYLKDYKIPVCCGFPGGHDNVNLPLIMGSEVTLEVTPEQSRISFNIDGESEDMETADAIAISKLSQEEITEAVGEKQKRVIRAFNFIKYFEGKLR